MLCLAAMLVCGALAEVVRPNDDFWYLDQANVFSEETEGIIFFANQALHKQSGAEIVVVAIDSTEGMGIEDYTYTLFNEWEIGGSRYLGMVLLMAIEDENYFCMPGAMMGQYIDSATISDMLYEYLEPDFARGRYDQGAMNFFEAMYEKVVDTLNLDLSIASARIDYQSYISENAVLLEETDHFPRGNKSGFNLGAILFIVILLIVLLRVTRSFRRKPRTYVPPVYGNPQPRRRSNLSSMMTGFALGRMMNNRPRYRGPGGMPPMGGPGPKGGGPFGGSSFGSSPNRSSGRSSFGGASRGSFGSGARSGFGGASRSGGGRGPSTRGGGAGRFGRR